MKILEFLQDDNGGFSATRLAFLLWVLGLLTIWLIASAKAGSLQAIPESVITLLGILMGGKVVQKFGEASVPAVKQTGQELSVGSISPTPVPQPAH